MPVVASGVDSRYGLGARAAGAATKAAPSRPRHRTLFSLFRRSSVVIPSPTLVLLPPPYLSRPRRLRRLRLLVLRLVPSPRSHLPTWFSRVLSTTAAARDAPPPEPHSAAAPAPTPAPPPKPKPEVKDPSPAELQTRYGHSSHALHALLAHPALFAPLRRPCLPIILCHGTPGRAVPTGQRPSSSARRSSTAHSPRACTAAA
jgi:hypothetical protein